MTRKKLKWLLVFAWMILIFWFSSMPATISDEKSHNWKYDAVKLFILVNFNVSVTKM